MAHPFANSRTSTRRCAGRWRSKCPRAAVALVEFLDLPTPKACTARLSRWCEACRGEYAWVFDSPVDTLASRMSDHSVIGFDVTEFLDNPQTRTPITAYLFHLVRQMLDGAGWFAGWTSFGGCSRTRLREIRQRRATKTWRKLNAVMCLPRKAPATFSRAPSAGPWWNRRDQGLLPSADANRREYMEGLGLTDRNSSVETSARARLADVSGEAGPPQRRVPARLKGFDAELAVISGRAAEISRMNDIISGCGPDPDQWLPTFMSTH